MSKVTPRIEDGPEWDFGMTVRGVELRFVSPLDMTADLPSVPTPEQAEIDRMTRRRRGVFLRVWWWLFGEPGVRRSDIPSDGGAEHVRMLVNAMVGPMHAEFLATLTTGELFQIHQVYMGCQDAWGERVQAWAAEQARASSPKPLAAEQAQPAGGVRLHPSKMAEQVAAVFGPPRKGRVPHLSGDNGTGEESHR